MQLLDGKSLSQKILASLRQEVETLSSPPRLDIVLVGSDSASLKYTQMKQKTAADVGITGEIHQFPDSATTEQIISQINQLNKDPQVTALMVQLPLPPQIDRQAVLNAIDPQKDADGLTPQNLGLLFQKDPSALVPATPMGIIKLLEEYQIEFSGKNAVILGRSSIVGIPLFALLTNKNSTVTLCHSHTQELPQIISTADILISAVGKPNFLNSDIVPQNIVLVDVGTNYDQDGHLVGDFDFDSVSSSAAFITPVPGGVGPMTIVSLLQNTVTIYKRSHYENPTI
jgi:methylenetetrahydrofolate dehydrogenase (NADP+)/methenyltetrahydrofolate cyclohydrolase